MSRNPVRERNTIATQKRADNMRMIVAAMSKGMMSHPDICILLKFTTSSARKYTLELQEYGVISVAYYLERHDSNLRGSAVYRITSDKELIARFLADLSQPSMPNIPNAKYGRKSDFAKAQEDEGRHFHVLMDDVGYEVKINKAAAQRDPLVCALFGPAKVAA